MSNSHRSQALRAAALVFLSVPLASCQADESGPLPTNRLADETSPYLLQHAHNPVDWYPWGEEALARSKKENKLIFLSIGYSSCHWCHVMEHESFEDDEIARYMNEHFVCVKVDREERPDVDAIYMLAVQVMTQRGGWPLSVFLTPEGKPLFGGTYFPARSSDRPGRPGFLNICKRVTDVWQANPDEVRETAKKIADAIMREMTGPTAAGALDAAWPQTLMDELSQSFDPVHGGFGFDKRNPNMPKFPQTTTLMFLLDQAQRHDNADARQMLMKTLDQMARGGMWDHLGGGFHRYSVDRYWAIPHFEKMLYDNGQLASAYARAAKLTGNDEYVRVVDQLLECIQRDMTSPEGAFYSAIDADSEGEEGKYYRWLPAEWTTTLGQKDAGFFGSVYAASGRPNFEHKYYVPQLESSWTDVGERLNATVVQLHERLDPLRAKLLAVRSQRVPPMTDTKILASWNGLMIRGMADAGRFLERSEYVERAAAAARFVLEQLVVDGRLRRTYSVGQARLNGYVDDYAFVVDGLLALHAATGDEKWLTHAQQLTDKQIELYWDAAGGGFFFTSADHEQLIVRGKLFHEGARPSGAAVSASNLSYLAEATGDEIYRDKAARTVKSAAAILNRSPAAAPLMVIAADRLTNQQSN